MPTLDSLRQKSPSLMAGMLWNGLMARYSGWGMKVNVKMDSNPKYFVYLHVFSSHDVAFLELIRHAKYLGRHLHNPRERQSCHVANIYCWPDTLSRNIDLPLYSLSCNLYAFGYRMTVEGCGPSEKLRGLPARSRQLEPMNLNWSHLLWVCSETFVDGNRRNDFIQEHNCYNCQSLGNH